MGKPYSTDLRERAVAAVLQGGLSRHRAAAQFGVRVSTVVNWVRRFQDTGSVARARLAGTSRSRSAASMRFSWRAAIGAAGSRPYSVAAPRRRSGARRGARLSTGLGCAPNGASVSTPSLGRTQAQGLRAVASEQSGAHRGFVLLKPDRVTGTRLESDGDEPSGPNRASFVALIAIVVIAALGYWAFTAIERQREIARCLDEGRRNCLDLVHPTEPGADVGK